MLSLLARASKIQARSYSTAATPRKVGAFRGGFLGFLLGVSTTGFGAYYYLLDQFTSANLVVVADVIALRESISGLERHVRALEERK